ncbi:hypothetical protein CXF95_11010 [Paraglaciecola sp. MB-3u-78]|jgi:hypothetical protein|nr:hypothetical protein CXF95_11010 [Paraglaciecola sp. MB-3u-78]
MFGLFIVLLFFLIWLVPIILVAKSNRTQGGEKVAWVLLIIFVSWLAWIFYLLLAPLKQNTENSNMHR